MSIYCYYVYAYIRSKDSSTAKAGTPYYIGKGKGNRAWSKQHNVILPPEHYIVILESNLSEIGALALERRYIRWYGRYNNGGTLYNNTDGGEGISGFKHTDKTKALISSKRVGFIFSNETKLKMSESAKVRMNDSRSKLSRPHTDETKLKMSRTRTGKIKSESHRKNLSNSLSGKIKSESHIKKISEGNKDLVWIHNNISEKRISLTELLSYIEAGWMQGRLKR